jgi:hypothetical protein
MLHLLSSYRRPQDDTTSIVYRLPMPHLSSPIVVLSNIHRRRSSSYPTSIVVLHVRIYLSVVYCCPLLCTILCVCPSVLVSLFHHLCGREGEILERPDTRADFQLVT